MAGFEVGVTILNHIADPRLAHGPPFAELKIYAQPSDRSPTHNSRSC
jgi:hypothetical protein